ncbi:proton-conducting transporter membrane subunit, partial [Streptosporangium algeriense]
MDSAPDAADACGFAYTLWIALTGVPAGSEHAWAPALGLDLAFRADALGVLMMALVTGVGALVLVYCSRYFDAGEEGLGRFGGVLVAFAGAMLGLVVADNLLLLYVFWELTTVFSYLLIGQDPRSRQARRAATQALTVTAAGGLAMLAGMVILGETAGTYRISRIVADPPSGALLPAAVVLLLAGALSKSAIFPFSMWLPAAMAAPTPVSAYLHAAAMVKAGVYLLARFGPAFGALPAWRTVAVPLGLLTMLLAGWRALREYDIKRLLAYGTVSQLGFMTALFGAATRDTALAGVAVLLGHGLFKASLFLVVGVVDHATGTRDLRVLNDLWRSAPWLCAAAV